MAGSRTTGIEVRHGRRCRSNEGGRCNCNPSYRAIVFDPQTKTQHRKTCGSRAEAVAWRQEALVAVRKGALAQPTPQTVGEALEALVTGMDDGTVLELSGRRYKPATVRDYRSDVRHYVAPALGSMRVSAVRRRDVQDLVDDLRARGLAPSTVHNKIDPLRVMFRRALRRDEIAIDPTEGLELPAVRGVRDRIVTPDEAAELLAALPDAERALWSCFAYAALRVGEARALRWLDVDLDANRLRVERGWDDVGGAQDPKSDAGRREVPLAATLRRELVAHKLRTGRDGQALVFGRTARDAFVRSTVRARAIRAWTAAGLDPIKPHELRHCAASYFIASGMDWKQISTWIGHGDVRQTWNRYGHLVPGDEATAAAKLDAYLSQGSAAR